ncbi:rhodanese-like domain-containing protein [Algibacter sp. Ld11]|uniref:rhodanese-like domain-containing protein n=1 Tax=Algibacter sp. Ld11 TaxID=649150 RepID=UPI0038670576
MSIFSTLFNSKSTKDNIIKVLDILEFKAQTQSKKVQLVDVRTESEFNTGHIQNAINIDLSSDDFNLEFSKLDKNQAVYVYCKSGVRSRRCSNKLAGMGFMEIYDLKGGILNYK